MPEAILNYSSVYLEACVLGNSRLYQVDSINHITGAGTNQKVCIELWPGY